ncbi:MAG: carbon storage regulator CsrA [Christensenellaceae bacterium]|jgi:carbon storage regulator
MLVLTRKANEAILIGDDITVTVLNVESDRVRIGIDAPKSMRIYRYETLKKVVLENQKAASVNVNLVELSQLKQEMEKEAEKD